MITVLCILVSFLLVWLVCMPFFYDETPEDLRYLSEEQSGQVDRLSRAVQINNDLELDYSLGNIPKSDFDKLSDKLSKQIAKLSPPS